MTLDHVNEPLEKMQRKSIAKFLKKAKKFISSLSSDPDSIKSDMCKKKAMEIFSKLKEFGLLDEVNLGDEI